MAPTFFMATGFHGVHVLIGTIFLLVCLFRAYAGHFTPKHHLGFEFAAWYWHFVDVVWLFLFASIYVWGSWGETWRSTHTKPDRLSCSKGAASVAALFRWRSAPPTIPHPAEAVQTRASRSRSRALALPPQGSPAVVHAAVRSSSLRAISRLLPRCESCGLDFAFADSGDGPAVFIILIAGIIVCRLLPQHRRRANYPPRSVCICVLWSPVRDPNRPRCCCSAPSRPR